MIESHVLKVDEKDGDCWRSGDTAEPLKMTTLTLATEEQAVRIRGSMMDPYMGLCHEWADP